MREDRTQAPESERNQPEDKSLGYKPWSETHQRWWTGQQWGDTYKEIDNAEARPDIQQDVSEPVGTSSGESEQFLPNSLFPTFSSAGQAKEVTETSSEEQDGSEDSSTAEGSEVMIKLFGDDPDDTEQYANTPFPQRAIQFAFGALATETAEDDDTEEYTMEELFVVWFAYTLGNWKALVSTTRSGDGIYCEVTHSKEKLETYVDIYKKQANHMFSHHDH
jgi:Family of unknown function (DUF6275)